jgi:pimeloyl-ACP methyl ester carboxylesterase
MRVGIRWGLVLFLAALLPAVLVGTLPAQAQGKAGDKPAIIFVPGFMTSEISDGGRRIWPPENAASGAADFKRMIIADGPATPRDGLTANRIMPDYDSFVTALGAHGSVHPFPYDWRQSVFDSAADLERFIESQPALRDAGRIVLVAHSMGGLVATAYAQNPAGVFRHSARVVKLITMGTPYLGSVQTVLDARNGIELAPGDIMPSRAYQQWTNSFPGFYEMLPAYLDGPDGVPCCIDLSGGEKRPLALWRYADWRRLDWHAGTYDPAAVQHTLGDGVGGIRQAVGRWRQDMPAWVFPIAGLTDWKGDTAKTTSLSFVAKDGRLSAGKGDECTSDTVICAPGDQAVAQFSASLGRASGVLGQHAGSCSVRLGTGPDGPIFHGDITDDVTVRASVFAALKAKDHTARWCRQERK